ncbi:TcpE family conjugal transfer membrane protein [Spirillospora sp. NPDC127200]
MDLPTYTNIWRIEKRLYKLYDLRLPMPLPLVQIGVFAGVFVPWIVLLRFVGIPFESPWHVLYVVPPGVLTWLATRPVIEGKRLTELLLSHGRYLAEPRTWCRLTPIREPREVVIVARVWRRPQAPAPVAAAERAAVKSRRKARKARKARPLVEEAPLPQEIAAPMPTPAMASAPQPLAEYEAQRDAANASREAVPAEERPAKRSRKRRFAKARVEEAPAAPAPAEEMAAMPGDAIAKASPPALPPTETAPAGEPQRVRETEAPAVRAQAVHTPAEEAQTARPETGEVPVAQASEQADKPRRAARPWRRSTRDIAHEDDAAVPPGLPAETSAETPADLAHPPATPQLEVPPQQQPAEKPAAPTVGSGKRAFASGVRRPGGAVDFWQAIAPPAPTDPAPEATASTPAPATRPDIPQQKPAAQAPEPEFNGEPGDVRVAGKRKPKAAMPPVPFPPPPPPPRPTAEAPRPPQEPEKPQAPTPPEQQTPAAQAAQAAQPAPAQRPQPVEQPAPQAPAARAERPAPAQPAQPVEQPTPQAPAAHAEQPAPQVPAARAERPEPARPSQPVEQPAPQAPAAQAERPEPQVPAAQEQAAPEQAAPEQRHQPVEQPAPQAPAAQAEQPAPVQRPQPVEPPAPQAPAAQAQPAKSEAAPQAPAQPEAEKPEAAPQVPAAQAERTERPDASTTRYDIPQVPPATEQRSRQREQQRSENQTRQDLPQRPGATRRDIPQVPAAQAGEGVRGQEGAPAEQSSPARPPAPTRPDIPMVPGAFGGAGGKRERQEGEWRPAKDPSREPAAPEPQKPAAQGPQPQKPAAQGPPQRPGTPEPERPAAQGPQPPKPQQPPKPWSKGLSKPVQPAGTDAMVWPPVPQPRHDAGKPEQQRPTGPQPGRFPTQGPPPRPPQGTPVKPEPPRPHMEPPPVPDEEPPPREVRSGPASPVRPRPLPPPPAAPPSEPAITPPDPEHEVTAGGLRRLIHAVGGGHGEADAEYQLRLQQPFQGTRHIVVLGCTGGAGQTVTALMLGHTFAQHNGEPVVAIDVNPGPGALARRTRSETNETLTGLITRADQVNSLTAMRRYTSQAKSGLDVIAAGKNPLQALDDRDYALAIRTIDRFYSVTLLDAAAAVVARVLPYADQIVLVAPASADAPRAVAMTFEWLDGHGYHELRSRAVTVINGVSRRSMDDVEQAEAVARGRCRALVRIPWDDHLSMDRAPRNELKSLRAPTRRAYLALAGVVAGGFTVVPERYQELQQEQEATR